MLDHESEILMMQAAKCRGANWAAGPKRRATASNGILQGGRIIETVDTMFTILGVLLASKGLLRKGTRPSMLVISLECRSRGPDMIRHGLASIGYAIGTVEGGGELLCRGRFDLAPMICQVQKEPVEAEILANAQDPRVQMQAFDALLARHERPDRPTYIIVRNSHDAGLINYYLNMYGLPALHYARLSNALRPVHAADTYTCGYDQVGVELLAKYMMRVPRIGNKAPEDAAENMYRAHLGLLGKL